MRSKPEPPRSYEEWVQAAFARGHRLQAAPFEDATYVQPWIAKRALHAALARLPWAGREFPRPGWLRLAGRDGVMVLGPVWHDGDAYVRQHSVQGEIAGSARLLMAHGLPDARLISDRELVAEALAGGDCRRIEREFDGAVFDVALLGPWPDWRAPRRTPAVRFQGGRLLAFNPEPAARKAFNTPLARHRVLGPLADGALVRRLADWQAGLDAQGHPPDPWPRPTACRELLGLAAG